VKKIMLSAVLLAVMAVAAEAQIYVEYHRKTSHSSLTVTYSSGYGCGYGYGGYGYGSGYGYPGYSGTYGGATYAYTPYGGWGYGYGPYTPYGYGSAYGGGYHYGRVPRMDYSPTLPAPAPHGVSDRTHELVADKNIEEGRRRFRAGDYRGALDSFRSALTTDLANGSAQAWFALALAVTGDGKNADKALRGAAPLAPFKVDLKDAFKDERERTRVMALLARMTGDGALTAAWAQSLAGDPARLKAMAEKDPVAKKLLGN
jgi:hypothetical protein